MRRVSRIIENLSPDSLREQFWALSTLTRFDLGLSIATAELTAIFHHRGSWATSMIADYKSCLVDPAYMGLRKPNLIKSGFEQELMQFCLVRQREMIPGTISDVIDYFAQRLITVDRWRVARFIEQHETELMV
jgi:hypothetical protein